MMKGLVKFAFMKLGVPSKSCDLIFGLYSLGIFSVKLVSLPKLFSILMM